MTPKCNRPSRRTVLGSILAGASAGLAGCAGLGATGGDVITSIDVDGTDLVLTVEPDTVDRVNLIAPSGELFRKRTIASGVSQRRIPIGVSYSPGEYEILALSDGETVGTSSVTLEPELELTELRLGRDHPDAMYDGASDSSINSEAILSVSNNGTGPTAVTALRFEGDIPYPTPEWYDENGDSGVYDEERGFGDADAVPIPAGDTVPVYSNSSPFVYLFAQDKCDPGEEAKEFTVRLIGEHELIVAREYLIYYSETHSGNCDFDIEDPQ